MAKLKVKLKVMHISNANNSDMTSITIAIKYEIARRLSMSISRFDIDPSQSSRSCTFRRQISLKWGQMRQVLLLPSNMKPHTSFRLTNLYLAVTHSQGEGLRIARFDGECL